jgi:hypothetical protein
MQEWSPYGQIHVRHLEDHDFRPGRVDFYLAELPGRRTQLDCWSTYENRMWSGSTGGCGPMKSCGRSSCACSGT